MNAAAPQECRNVADREYYDNTIAILWQELWLLRYSGSENTRTDYGRVFTILGSFSPKYAKITRKKL